MAHRSQTPNGIENTTVAPIDNAVNNRVAGSFETKVSNTFSRNIADSHIPGQYSTSQGQILGEKRLSSPSSALLASMIPEQPRPCLHRVPSRHHCLPHASGKGQKK